MEDPEVLYNIFLSINAILGAIDWFYIAPSVVFIVFLLIISALISGSEVAYFSLTNIDIEKLKSTNAKTDKAILALLNNPQRLLATILVSNNFVNVGIVILSTFITNDIIGEVELSKLWLFIIQGVLITFLLLLFGEVIPKVYATQYSMSLARKMAYPLKVCWWATKYISLFLIHSTSIIDKRINKNTEEQVSVEDLSKALEITSKKSTSSHERMILEGIVNFGNVEVSEVMTARIDVFAFDYNTAFKQLLNEALAEGYSRIPIYKHDFDHIIGILHIKDLLAYKNEPDTFNWQDLIRKAIFVPENKKLDALLKEFQSTKKHLAVVVDEYGGSSGIVTLEDVLEEIVGEIDEEEDEMTYQKINDTLYTLEGKTTIYDLCKILNQDTEYFYNSIDGEFDTIAGFILELKGFIPNKGDVIRFKNLEFTIQTSDLRRIKQIKMRILK